MIEMDDYLMKFKAGIYGPPTDLKISRIFLFRDRPVFVRESLDQGKLSVKNKAPLFVRMDKPFILSKTIWLYNFRWKDNLSYHRAVAKEMFNSAVGKRESRFDQNQVGCSQIHCPC